MIQYSGIPVRLSEFYKTDSGGALENLALASAEGARRKNVALNLSGKRTKHWRLF